MSIRKLTHIGAIAVGASVFAFLGSGFTAVGGQQGVGGRGNAHHFGAAQPGGLLTAPLGETKPDLADNTSKIVSTNWAGYAVTATGTRFQSIEATFFVPYVDCASTPDSFSGHWVGIDGVSDPTAEQDGILAACQGTKPTYSAWYEMFPEPPVYSDIHIETGNSVTVSVTFNTHSAEYTLRLTDTTNGQHFSVTGACPSGVSCQRASAEAISEAPSSDGALLPLANFRSVDFLGITVASQGSHDGGLRSHWWRTLSITTLNSGGHILDQPTSVYHGTAFSTYWMRQK
ncbi:MAG TPA: G1 family glutamic endopeptidase [Streptosporangiaceae bacterium]|nr:G1 family glutamic endopeptidase [Streptosporangiaceae bacterium]